MNDLIKTMLALVFAYDLSCDASPRLDLAQPCVWVLLGVVALLKFSFGECLTQSLPLAGPPLKAGVEGRPEACFGTGRSGRGYNNRLSLY